MRCLGRCSRGPRQRQAVKVRTRATGFTATSPAGAQTPWTKLLNVHGRLTEVIGTQDVGKEEVHVVIIPGNPGAAGYYREFLQAVQSQCSDAGVEARVWAVSSVGFHTQDHPIEAVSEVLELQQQCAHKAAFLDEYCIRAHDLPVVIVGHSIGAYMAIRATQVLERREISLSDGTSSDKQGSLPTNGATTSASRQTTTLTPSDSSLVARRLRTIIGVCPFFQTTSNDTQRFIRRLSSRPGAMARVGAVLARAPPSARRALRPLWSEGMDADAIATTEALFLEDAFRASFTLARSEFRALDADSIWEELKDYAGRLCVVTGTNDKWFPDEHIARCQSLLPAEDVVVEPSMVHGFCISDAQSKLAATVVSKWVRRAAREYWHGSKVVEGATSGTPADLLS